MAASAAFVAVLLPSGSASRSASLPSAIAYERDEAAGGGIVVVERSGRSRVVAARGHVPSWSPDGRRLAYVATGASGESELHVVDADGHHRSPITRSRGADEVAADWSADGRRLVVERNLRLLVIGADGRGERVLTSGTSPVWAPKGDRIAFVSDRSGSENLYVIGADGHGLWRVTTSDAAESEPAWSPDGQRLAFVSLSAGFTDVYVVNVQNHELVRLTQDSSTESSPVWSPGGENVWYISDRTDGGPLWSVRASGGVASSLGGPKSVIRLRRRPPISADLRPDLEQRAPTDLSFHVLERGRRYLLGFTSATDNLGDGPLSIVASRPSRARPTMKAAQRVRIGAGGSRTYPNVGFLRYTVAFPHRHWHLMDFQRYELRRASDHALVVRDRKSGFCLADHWALVPGVVPGKPRRPVFKSNCGEGNPRALGVAQGTSVGYTDRYPAHFHGQNLDVSDVPTGTYVLVHRANPNLLLRELRYENNAASLLIRLSWPRGRAHPPAIALLAICPSTERCPA